jgi:hypothetical protein
MNEFEPTIWYKLTEKQLEKIILTAYGEGIDFCLVAIGKTPPKNITQVIEQIKETIK